jgi:large subunit ribosomal protein L25
MSQATLRATTSRPEGTRNSKRLRREGIIPAVLYGHGVEPIAVAVDAKEFRHAVSGDQGLNSLITLEAGDKSYPVLARELQRHPVRGTVSHIDFQVVDPNQAVAAEVPLHVEGDAVEVRHADWEVDQQLFAVHVLARPADIPVSITVDISELKPGGAIRIADLALPTGVVADGDPQAIVVTSFQGRAAKTSANAATEA